MTTRVLPKEEWPRLKGTEAETVWPYLNPERASVIVVESEGVIVGCHVLLYVLHAECLWIAPAHRGTGGVARRLWFAVKRAVLSTGATALVTAACDDTVRGLLAHVGATKLPGDQYSVPVQE